MAKGDYFSGHQQSIVNRYYEHLDTVTLQKLSELVSDLYVCTAPTQADRLWTAAARALARAGVGMARAGKIVREKRVEDLAALVTELSGGKPGAKSDTKAAPPADTSAPSTPSAASPFPADSSAPSALPGTISPDTLKVALKAFKKRLKVTRLDDESKLGRPSNPMTGGTSEQIVAIQPPNQFPRSVWDELVRQGKLKTAGPGFYKLVE